MGNPRCISLTVMLSSKPAKVASNAFDRWNKHLESLRTVADASKNLNLAAGIHIHLNFVLMCVLFQTRKTNDFVRD
jgi:hypothetical protein